MKVGFIFGVLKCQMLFCFNGLEVRSIVLENGDVWFVGRDVAQIFEYVNTA